MLLLLQTVAMYFDITIVTGNNRIVQTTNFRLSHFTFVFNYQHTVHSIAVNCL